MTAPLPDFERSALTALQRALAEAHKLYFTVSGVGVVSGGRFRVSLACPDSEWLDLRRNVFELGRAPAALACPPQSTMASRVSSSVSPSGPGKVG